jgi:hypothetical protein
MNARGYNSAAGTFLTAAAIGVTVDGAPDITGPIYAIPGRLDFFTTPTNSATTISRMSINSTGIVDIPGKLTVLYGKINATCFCEVTFGNGAGGEENYALSSFGLVDFHNLEAYSLTDPGSHYDDETDHYIVPYSGVYRVTTKLRRTDGDGGGSADSYGHGGDVVNQDSPNFMWFATTISDRNGSLNIRTSHFNANQEIRMFAYSGMEDPSAMASDGSMTIELLYAD